MEEIPAAEAVPSETEETSEALPEPPAVPHQDAPTQHPTRRAAVAARSIIAGKTRKLQEEEEDDE